MVSTTRLTLLLACAVAIGPFAIDTYLPAFPRIGAALGVDSHQVSLTISVYMLGFALGQLGGGALSDRSGRRAVMLGGLALFAAASVAIALSTTLTQMLTARVVQALGAGATVVCVPAIVRDRASGSEAARLFSTIALIMIIAPAIAPSVGAAILAVADWPAIFLALAAYAALLICLLQWGLFARLREAPRGIAPAPLLAGYLVVLRYPVTRRYTLVVALGFATMLVFITHASFIYQHWFGLSESAFAMVFAANIVTMGACNLANRQLLTRFAPARILTVSLPLQALAAAGLVLVALLDLGLWVFVPCMMLAVGSLGMITPNAQACALQPFDHGAGTAAAVIGFTQFTLAGGISAASAAAPETLATICLVMLACAGVAALLAVTAPE